MADELTMGGEFLSKIRVILDKLPYALTSNHVVSVLRVKPMGFSRRFCQCFGGSLATLLLAVVPALAEELHDWAFDTATNELTFSLSDAVLPQFFLLSEPPRLVLDIPDTEIGMIAPEQIYNGAVQTIRVAQYTPDQVRVVIELTPDIVLSPDQADIQFDDRDGVRRWRFRPLIAEGDTAVAVDPTTSPSAPRSSQGLSLSAANLQLSGRQPTSTALPIDPYDADASSTVVTVPPLENLPVDAAGAPAAIATAPDLPPMTVPELEQPQIDQPEMPAVAAVPGNNRASLPDISARVPSETPNVTALPSSAEPASAVPSAEPASAVPSAEPDSAVLAVTETGARIEEIIVPEEIVPEATVPEEIVPEEIVPEEIAPEIDTAVEVAPPLVEVPVVAAVSPDSGIPTDIIVSTVAEPVPVAESVPDVAALPGAERPVPEQAVPEVVPEQAASEPAAPEPAAPGQPLSTTGLAPVELSLVETPGAENDSAPVLETIQQPAARRTITQTQQPAPLTFGQPLPSETH